MKLFVATESLDGKGDFSFTVPGELVHFPPVVCDCPDCGCDMAMTGFVSHKATTCFVVRDLDIDATAYAELLFETLREGGWVAEGSAGERDRVREWAVEHIEMAADLPAETPLCLDREQVVVRGADRAL